MKIRVLIADDQALIRSGLRAIIESEPGLEVIGEAGDGAEAVEAVRRLRPDVALMDIRMPRLDGVAATRALLRGAAPVPTKILILTTFHLDAYVTEALRAGASGFLLKEATADQLIEAVRVIAAGEAILAPSVTRRLLERMADGPGRDRGRRTADQGPAVRPRGRRAAAGRPRTVKRRDRHTAPLGRDHGKKPRAEHAGQARRARSPSGRGRRLRFRAGAAARGLTIFGRLVGRPGYGQGLTRARWPGGLASQGVTTSFRGAPVLRCSQVSLMSSSRVCSRSAVSLPSIAWPARIRDGYQLGQGAVRRWRGCHVPAGAIGELHDCFVAGDAGGCSRRSGNWSFTNATSSGFRVAACGLSGYGCRTGCLLLGVWPGLAGCRAFGQPGVQPVPDLGGGVGAAAPLVADDHHASGGHACESGQSQHLEPAHLLRLEHVCREYQPG
jgi:DNA-binding NarL/FixJ family response regulator